MLLQLILVISLLLFMLLMISGVHIDIALYRSLLVFIGLFSVIYISIFLLNIVRDNKNATEIPIGDNNQNTPQET
jgi:hypothetical protein